ncbi:MAG TPA: pseudouridine synthase [Chthonomonadaceae bacterium]|nr:pseudouridine synthase [Chthonomonadaceae bacterium]
MPRLQKVLAAAGVASRRACETLITEGRVQVNGKTVRELGTRVNPQTDTLRVDGQPIAIAPSKPVYIMLNKPVGYVCTVSDAHAEHTVLELIAQVEERVFPVGRLDADTAGLLLLTNDGEFTNRLTHPRYHVPKVYRVRAKGFVGREEAIRLSEGIELTDGKTAPADLAFVEYDTATQCTILDITLFEGRNRQVRRMMDAVGHPVRELTRIAYGNLKLKGLNPGTWRKLREEEVASLLELAKPTQTPKKEARRSATPFRPRNEAPSPPQAPQNPAAATRPRRVRKP